MLTTIHLTTIIQRYVTDTEKSDWWMEQVRGRDELKSVWTDSGVQSVIISGGSLRQVLLAGSWDSREVHSQL